MVKMCPVCVVPMTSRTETRVGTQQNIRKVYRCPSCGNQIVPEQ